MKPSRKYKKLLKKPDLFNYLVKSKKKYPGWLWLIAHERRDAETHKHINKYRRMIMGEIHNQLERELKP